MTQPIFPILAALIFPFALLLLIKIVPFVSLGLLARASPPGGLFRVLSLSLCPSTGRSPPII
jgi:hypothetical protein